MIDLLTAWGVTSAAGLIFKPVLQDLYQELKGLTKDATEDWVKDFFKDRLSAGSTAGYGRLLSRIHREPLDIAAGKAIKGFLEIVQDCLDDADLDDQAIAVYNQDIKLLLREQCVRSALGSPFRSSDAYLDTGILKSTWEKLDLQALPDNFNWDRLSKKYLKKVQAIYQESDELKKILEIQLQQQSTDSLEQLAGITTGFDLLQYQETILEKYSNLKLESLDSSGYIYDRELKIYQIFIPQKVKECQEYLPQVYELPKELQRRLKERGELEREITLEELERYKQAYSSQQIKSILDVIGDRKYKYLVILGDPGSGKSMLLQYLAVEWAKLPPRELPSHPLTLLIELQKYIQDFNNQRCHNFLEYIHQGSNWIGHLNQNELNKRLQQAEVRILFDGLDEVFDPQLRSNIISQIHSFTQTYPQVKVIVTSRIIGYKPQQLKDAEFHHFMLQDLASEQIDLFLTKWHDLTYNAATESQKKQDRHQRIAKAIKDSQAIQQLVGNPLLLTMMAILNRNQDLPRDRAELYKEASKLLLHQWDVEAKLLEDPELKAVAIDHRDKQAMLRDVAQFMQGTEKGLAGNLISQTNLTKVITKYLTTLGVPPSQRRRVAQLMIQQLRTRNFILCDVGGDYYAFVHRTFLEYFCAWSYIWQLEAQTLSIEKIKTEVFSNHWQDESWHEVLRLIAGMILDPLKVGEIIEYLMKQDSESANFANLFLAADCLSEVRNRKSIIRISDRLLERLKLFAQQVKQFSDRSKEKNLNRTLSEKVIKAIVNNWQNDPTELTWLKTCLKFDKQSYVPELAVVAIAESWKNEPNTLSFLRQLAQSDNDNESVRGTAIIKLSQEWQEHPETLPIIQQLARSDNNYRVRSTAVVQLAQEWQEHPETLFIIQQLAQSDNNYRVKSTAIIKLSQEWHEHPETLPIIQQLAQSDNDYRVRSTAVVQLAQEWQEHPETLLIIQQLAQSDNNYSVINTAMHQIALKMHSDSSMFELLGQYAVDNLSFETRFRINVLKEILKYSPNHPQTKDLLVDRLNNDLDEQVRNFAQQALKELS